MSSPAEAGGERLELPHTILLAPGVDDEPLIRTGWVDTGETEGDHRIYKRAEES